MENELDVRIMKKIVKKWNEETNANEKREQPSSWATKTTSTTTKH